MRRVHARNFNSEDIVIGHTVKLADGRYRAYSYGTGNAWECDSYSVARHLVESNARMDHRVKGGAK